MESWMGRGTQAPPGKTVLPVSAAAALTGSYVRLQTLADGTPRVLIDLDCRLADLAAMALEPGVALAVARLDDEAGKPAPVGAPYGEEARVLRLSGFFATPDVWRAIGPDKDFLAWIRAQPCAVWKLGKCAGEVVAAHVRRIADGAGTGAKPDYACLPLCDGHHRQQHQRGESALGGREWFDAKRIEYVREWGWQALKAELGYEHWNLAPPGKLLAWAQKRGVERYLPRAYREAA